jgi:hypothetical protein
MADKQQQKKKQEANPYSGKFVPKKKDPLRPFLPVLGLLIVAAAGAVAWFGSPFLLDWLLNQQNYVAMPAAVLQADELTLQMLASIMIFFIIIAIGGLLYAVVAPRPPKLVSESVLAAERKQIELDRQRDVARKRKMKSRMKNANKGMDDI